jgi:hypothetical protein
LGTVIDNQRAVELPLDGPRGHQLVFLAQMATVGDGQT